MGLIRVSDETEQRIKEIKGAKSVGAAVDDLLTKNDIAARLDKLALYLEQKFASLERKLDDTTIDRIAVGPRRVSPSRIIDIDWPIFQELWLEHIDDRNNPAWVAKAVYDSFEYSDDAASCTYYIKDDQIWSEFMGQNAHPIVNLTPEVTQFLTEKGVL